jgi:cold shock CspA family protein
MEHVDDTCDTSSDKDLILEARPDTLYGEYIGNCKWFNSKLGYGFLRICNTALKGTDVFVHHTGLRPLNSSFKTLYKGEYVHFSTIDGRNGKQAVSVTGILGGPLMCDNITGWSVNASSNPIVNEKKDYKWVNGNRWTNNNATWITGQSLGAGPSKWENIGGNVGYNGWK